VLEAVLARWRWLGKVADARTPNGRNGFNALSRLMVDKTTTVSRNKLGRRIRHLDAIDIERVNQAILIFLGLAG
jgi:mRNA interferase MazF